MPWNPTAAVLVHANVPYDPAVFTILKGEENLLIHKCSARAERKSREWIDTAGDCVLRVDSEPVLWWDVQASMLSQGGLANYHPGRKLTDRSLAWANGAPLPFQFRTGPHTVFIYEAPGIDPNPGDLPGFSFRIRCQFAEFDADTYPVGGDDSGGVVVPEEPGGPIGPEIIPPVVEGGGGVPVTHVDLPMQETVEWPLIHAEARQVMLQDVWQGFSSLEAGEFSAQCYEIQAGVPAPIAVSPPIPLAPWVDITDDPASPWICEAACKAFKFTDVSNADRTVTFILFLRGTVMVGVFTLEVPFVIPAHRSLSVPAGALGFRLEWPLDNLDAEMPPASAMPWRMGIAYICGGNRAACIPEGGMTVEVWQAAGPRIDIWWEHNVTGTWTVAGSIVGAAGLGLRGVAVSPAPGWTVARVRITLGTGAAAVIISNKEYAPGLAVAAGTRIVIPPGPFLNLAVPPV